MSWERWDEAIDELISEILRTLAVDQPPVDALFVARAAGCELAFDAAQTGRARQKLINGQTAIFLKPEDRPERLQWAAAHELGEIFAWQICKRVSENLDELPFNLREQLANRFASRLLLPTGWYSKHFHETGFDLYLFKEHFPTASHELIARRLLDFSPHRILTIIDRNEVVHRQNGYQSRPGPLLSFERQLVVRCHGSGRFVSQDFEGIRCDVWPVHEPGWKREILLTYAAEESIDEAVTTGNCVGEMTC
jgi:Zn-dependent peptidase ImmA (M78 family)